MITQENTNSKLNSWALQFLKTGQLTEVIALIYPNFSALANQSLLFSNANFHFGFSKFFLTQGHSSVRGKQILGYTFIRPIKDFHQSKPNETKGCMRKIKRWEKITG